MNTYSTVRNQGFAAIVVAALAGITSHALTLDQQIVFERTMTEVTAAVVLPELVVTATRLDV
jgi:hypothetical protein